MKLKFTRLQITVITAITMLLFLYVVQASDNNLPGIQLSGSNECNVCHGPSHKGHVSYTITLNSPEALINDTQSTISIVVNNNDFPLSKASLTLVETSDYSLAAGDVAIHNLGTLARGSSSSTEWKIVVHVPSAKNVDINAKFSGTAIDHKTNTYTKTITKTIIASTTPTAILKVESDPPTGSTFYKNDKIIGKMKISNVGNLEMTNITITATGSITVDGKSKINIPVLKPNEEYNYTISVDSSKIADSQIVITASSTTLQQAIVQISVQNRPPLPLSLVLGRIIGYLAYILLFLSVITGVAKYPLRKWFSGRKLRILHADLSNLGFTLVVIHAISLTIPNSPWSNSYQWFQVLPTGFPTELTAIGLELGRWGLIIMYISILSGYYFSTLIKRFGRKIGIRIHMLSYIALIAGVIHAISIGGTASKPLITFLLIITLGIVAFLKIDAIRQKSMKQDQRQERMQRSQESKDVIATKLGKAKTKTESQRVEIAKDARTGTSRSMGIVCWNCMSLNDEDANFCKSCGKILIGLVCTSCDTRNDPDAKFCKKCGNSEFRKLDEGFKHG